MEAFLFTKKRNTEMNTLDKLRKKGGIFAKAANKASGQEGMLKGVFRKSSELADQYADKYSSDLEGMQNTNTSFSQLAQDLNNQRGQTYTDSTEGRSFLSTLKDQREQAGNQINNSANLMDLSPEAYLAMMNNVNQGQAGSIRDMVAGSDARKANLNSQYSGALAQLFGGQQGLLGSKYQFDRDALGTFSGLWQNKYSADQQRKAANAGAIGQGIGGLLSIGSSFIPGGG